MTERPNAELVYLADVARQRRAAKASAPRSSDMVRTRLHVAAMIATVIVMAVSWVAAQGLTNVELCPHPNQTVCGP